MKNLKKSLPVIAIILGLGIAFSASAFKSANQTSTVKYRFIGTSTADLHDISKWDDVSAQPTPTPCEVGTELPCLVEFQTSEYDDIQDFLDQNETVNDMVSTNKVTSLKD